MPTGELVVVGTGIRAGVQLTPEARRHIVAADRVYYLFSEPLSSGIIEDLNPTAASLHDLYAPDKDRSETYAGIVERVLEPVRKGRTVCVAFYGHPGVFVTPGHEAIRVARREGHSAFMLPGVSAEDCLFADLGVDPGDAGCQSFTAQDFLTRPRSFDPHTPLILWQIVAVGDRGLPEEPDSRAVLALARVLERHYGPRHEVILYTAAVYPVGEHSAMRTTIRDLPTVEIPKLASLFVPPLGEPRVDEAMLRHLGLDARRSEISASPGTAE